MGDSRFNPADFVRETPLFDDKTAAFTEAWHDGRKVYRVDPGTIFLNWNDGGVYTFDYPGRHGLLMVPFAGIFQPTGPDPRVFELTKRANTLTLRGRADIQHDGLPVDGTLRFSYAIYDFEFDSFAIGHSPPDMVVGP